LNTPVAEGPEVVAHGPTAFGRPDSDS
jgi:hypothetical protein